MGIFSPEQRDVMYEGAETIGGILRDRFNSKQAEDFIANEMQQYSQLTAEFNNSLGTFEDGDSMGAAFLKYQNDTSAWAASNSARYANNPRIKGAIDQVMNAQLKGLDDYMKIEQYGDDKSHREEAEALGTRKIEAEIGASEASSTRSLAGARESDARTKAINEELEQKGSNIGIDANAPLGDVRQKVRSLYASHPVLAKSWGMMADDKAVASLVKRSAGKKRSDGQTWGVDSESDWKFAQSEWLASANRPKVQEAYIAKQLGYELNNAEEYFSDVMGALGSGDPRLPEERQTPLRAGASETDLMTRVFATEQSDLVGRDYQIGSVAGFVKNTLKDLPRSTAGYRQLGAHVTSILEETVKADADGQLIDVTTGKPIRTYADLRTRLQVAWNLRGSGALVDPSATALKTSADVLGRAIIAKYAPVIAHNLGVPIGKAEAQKIKQDDAWLGAKLLRKLGDVGGLLSDIGIGRQEGEPFE